MDVQLPDGTVIKDIPEGTSKADLTAKLKANGYDTSKLDAPAQADYSNEPRSPLPKSKDFTLRMPEATKNYNASDSLTGMRKGVADVVRGAGLDQDYATGVFKREKQPSYLDTVDEEYKKAGKTAGVTKFLTEAAITALPSAKAGAVARSAINEAPTLLGRTLGRAVEGGVGGAVGGAILAPEGDATRAGNAVSGALLGTVASPVIGLAGEGVNAAKKFIQSGPLTRAREMIGKAIGEPEMSRVTSELNMPRELPMSTAAASGSDPLAALEKTARSTDTKGVWQALDDSTKAKAWERTGEALEGRIADLQPSTAAFTDAMKPFQTAMNKMPVKSADQDALVLTLEQLRRDPVFTNSPKGQADLNKIQAAVSAPKTTVGGLANLHTTLADEFPNLSATQAQLVRDRLLSKVDTLSDGSLSKAYAARAAAQPAKEQSEAANAIYNQFQDAYGGARGKTVSGAPELTSDKLQNATIRHGTDASDKLAPRDVLNPDDRQSLEGVISALRRAEFPKSSSVAPAPMVGQSIDTRGNPVPGLNSKTWVVARTIGDKLLSSRNAATREAASEALRDPLKWQPMLDAATASSEITASDARMLANILRGVGPAAGALADQRRK